MSDELLIQIAATVDKKRQSAVMEKLLTDEKTKSYDMFEQLATLYEENPDKRDVIDATLMILTWSPMRQIARNIVMAAAS